MKLGLILATVLVGDDGKPDQNIMVPLGLGYVAESVRRALPDVEVVMRENISELIADRPDVVGISSVSEHYHIAVKWAREVKRSLNVPVIIGGVHISLLPTSLEDCFDVGVVGEGERTIVELMQSIISNNGINYGELKSIKGLFFYHDGEPCATQPREFIDDLDSLPSLLRETLPFFKASSLAHVFTARGCPYRCSFCASTRLFRTYRSHSVRRIVDELENLISTGNVKTILFFDDLLIASKKRLAAIVGDLEARGLLGKCDFTCQVRANLVDEETCSLLNKLGVTSVGIGLESFSDKMLKYYNKQHVTCEVNQRALDLLYKHGIQANPAFIFGGPVETEEDLHFTLEKIFHNVATGRISGGAWSLLRPYPGTDIWDYAEKRGLVTQKMDWGRFSDWSNCELYLAEMIPLETLVKIVDEWRVKFTLASGGPDPAGWGNLLIRDEEQFRNHLDAIYERGLSSREPRAGDELIEEAIRRQERGEVVPLQGIWPNPPDTWVWMAGSAKLMVQTGKKGIFSCEVVVPDLLESLDMLPMTVEFGVEGHMIRRATLSSVGSYKFELPFKKKDRFRLAVTCDKAMIPRDKGISDDGRELSVILNNLRAE